MQGYPLIFRFSSVVANERFRARVRGTGRALARIEDGQWACSGVEPGGLVESGRSPVDAYLGFRKTLDEILAQLADDSGSIGEFATRLLEFFATRDDTDWASWLRAVDDLRSQRVTASGGLENLPRASAETQPEIVVEDESSYREQAEVLSLASPEPLTKAA